MRSDRLTKPFAVILLIFSCTRREDNFKTIIEKATDTFSFHGCSPRNNRRDEMTEEISF